MAKISREDIEGANHFFVHFGKKVPKFLLKAEERYLEDPSKKNFKKLRRAVCLAVVITVPKMGKEMCSLFKEIMKECIVILIKGK